MAAPYEPIAYPFPPPPSLYEPAPEFGELRDSRPVAQVIMPDGKTAWLVTGYAEVRHVLVDQRFSRRAASGPNAPSTSLRIADESDQILGMDPPEHTRLRRLVARAFTARRVEELRPRVAKLVDELLDTIETLPRPVDLVEHFSLPLPVQVICELLGVPAADQHTFHAWSDTLMSEWGRDQDEFRAALDDLGDYFRQLIAFRRLSATKRAEPADDLMTALIAARDEQDKLSERELIMLSLELLIAGHETTANQINMFLLTLLHYPDELARLTADPNAIAPAVEELMRFAQLGAGMTNVPRVTTEEVELGGVTLPAGAAVLPAFIAANRDPAVFEAPDRLDLSRAENPHLGFGAGVHHCLGAQLARMELQEALRGLLRRIPDVRVAVPESELRFKAGMVLRSLEALPITW
jgi:cytochrome P450